MSKEFVASRLDLVSFAQAAARLEGADPLQQYERLNSEAEGDTAGRMVNWSVSGESRTVRGGADEVWLHLHADVALPMICQRCLTPVEELVTVDRPFRFAPDEDAAAALDEESEEDVLALTPAFNVPELVEDELLMALPAVPRHDVCPVPVKLVATDKEFEEALAAKPNPFATLAKLKG
ncbi:MAG: DUF177 domain-containing protein [Comamonadaceae bacterium]|nr:MAG: DUF177 domain-containing protein [Comamonadaceae bacterium]